MFTSFKRIFNFAWQDFTRNKGISLAAVFVLVITIMLTSWLFFFHGIAGHLISEIQNKIDITAYFKDGVAEQDILDAKDQIMKMSSDIKNIEYVSQDQALEDFNAKHQDNPILARALTEVGSNPFLPSLNITTNGDPAQYQQISDVLQTSNFAKIIDKVDFSQKKDTIEKVYSITKSISRFGIILDAVLAFVAILVVFNTLKLAIENSKDEITTMRVVGASDWFIRGPFIIQGAIYGVIGFLVCIFLSGVFAYFMSPYISAVLPGFNMFKYLKSNFWVFSLIQLSFGIGVGVISSFIVVKKYLKV